MKLNQDLNSLLNSLHTGHKSVLHLRYVLPFSLLTILGVFIRLAPGLCDSVGAGLGRGATFRLMTPNDI